MICAFQLTCNMWLGGGGVRDRRFPQDKLLALNFFSAEKNYQGPRGAAGAHLPDPSSSSSELRTWSLRFSHSASFS